MKMAFMQLPCRIACSISAHDPSLDYAKPIILRLPYHGIIEKHRVHWKKIPVEVKRKLTELIEEGLIQESDSCIKLTKLGWYWYVNMMYYLMPNEDQMAMNQLVVDKLKQPGRFFTKTELLYLNEPLLAD